MTSSPLARRPIADELGTVLPGGNAPLASLSDDEVIEAFRAHGAIHFTGWRTDTDSFVEFTERFCSDFSTYEGGSARWGAFDREAITADRTVMTTTGGTQSFPIPLHAELTYMSNAPRILWFYCERPSPEGGETTLGDAAAFYSALSEDTRRFFEENRVRYLRDLEDGDWQTAFLTDDPEEVRRICAEKDTTAGFDEETGRLTTSYTTSAVVDSPDGAGRLFLNNVLPLFMAEWAMESGWTAENLGPMHRDRPPLVVRMEDGSRIPGPVAEELIEVGKSVTVGVPWEPGELVMVDNARVMHGRNEGEGEGRSILVRMGDPTFPA